MLLLDAPTRESHISKMSERQDALPILTLEHVSKSFFGVKAVDDVSLTLTKGHLLGLVGENGAGKSTLMNMLGGVLSADEGVISVNGASYAPKTPRDAAKAGIAFIHQELNLFTNLTLAENLFVNGYPRRFGLLDRSSMARRAASALAQVGLEAPPSTRLEDLSPGERQLVEIAKALLAEATMIIFDEPTTSLTERETERLFGILQGLKKSGTSIIYISHILGDVLRLADDVAVLRDGRLIEQNARAAFTPARMISLMVGRDLNALYPPRTHEVGSEKIEGETLLEVRGLSQPGIVHDITFRLHRGEVLGLYGLMGSGRSELARILFGLDSFASGEVELSGAALAKVGPRGSIHKGLAFVTEDRRAEGLMMPASVADNLSLVTVAEHAGPLGLLDGKKMQRRVADIGGTLHIKTQGDYKQPVKTLSGGNQQKTVLGKWVASKPSVFLLDEPTRGVDVGAKFEVYSIIQDLAAEGAGVLFISSELEELIGVCDALLVMRNGEIVRRFGLEDFDREHILAAAFGEAA